MQGSLDNWGHALLDYVNLKCYKTLFIIQQFLSTVEEQQFHGRRPNVFDFRYWLYYVYVTVFCRDVRLFVLKDDSIFLTAKINLS